MVPRISTIGAVLVATLAAVVASLYITAPWDMLATVIAATGATAILLLIAVRLVA